MTLIEFGIHFDVSLGHDIAHQAKRKHVFDPLVACRAPHMTSLRLVGGASLAQYASVQSKERTRTAFASGVRRRGVSLLCHRGICER